MSVKLVLLVVLGVFTCAGLCFPQPVRAEVVYVVKITDDIDLGLVPFVERSVREASEANAAAIIFEIDTFGGRMDSMLNICEAIDKATCPTIAYCKYKTLSAGALVALSCDTIYVRSGGTIGAATPVIINQEGMEKAGEKIVSAARSMFRTWAQKKNHPVNIAEAMVDEDIEILEVIVDGTKRYLTPEEVDREESKLEGLSNRLEITRTVSAKGKLLTLTSSEAVQYGFATAEVESLEELLEKLGLDDVQIVSLKTNWSETLVRHLTSPTVSGILMMLGLLGIYTEMKMPGFGAPGILGLACFALFFWSRHLVHMADYPEMILFVLGFALLAVELFLIPGFGFVGVLGAGCIIASILMSFLPGISLPDPALPWQWNRAAEGVTALSIAVLGLVVLIPVIIKFLPGTPFLNKLILTAAESRDAGYQVGVAEEKSFAIGDRGEALSTLRPSGRARIGDATVDVVAQGDFIEKGESVRIHEIKGNRVVVRKA